MEMVEMALKNSRPCTEMHVIASIQITSGGVYFLGSKMAGSEVWEDPCLLLTPTCLLHFSLQSCRDGWFWYLWADLFFVLCFMLPCYSLTPWAEVEAAVAPCSGVPMTWWGLAQVFPGSPSDPKDLFSFSYPVSQNAPSHNKSCTIFL